jgi:hypothetical protein
MRPLKLNRLQKEYDLPDLDAQLRDDYLHNGDSLRAIARKLNVEITRQFLEDEPFEAELVYQVYKEPEAVSKQTQVELKKRLQNAGIDVDRLRNDWVTHNPVRQYCNKELDIDTSRKTSGRSPDEARETITDLVAHQETLIDNVLASIPGFDAEQWEIHTDLRLINRDTGATVRVQEQLDELDAGTDSK